MRAKRPFVFTNFKSGEGVDQIAKFVIEKGGLAKSAAFSHDRSIGNLSFFQGDSDNFTKQGEI